MAVKVSRLQLHWFMRMTHAGNCVVGKAMLAAFSLLTLSLSRDFSVHPNSHFP
jgi:hypothetical protein